MMIDFSTVNKTNKYTNPLIIRPKYWHMLELNYVGFVDSIKLL